MVELILGDCLEILPTLEEGSVDTIITDPPYGLEFMGKDWDCGIPGKRFWEEALRVAKPGAMLLAFGGTRTFHRLTCAIEDAGWEIRDCIMWVYGSGFPKSHNIGKAIDKAVGAEREVVGSRLGQPGYSLTDANNQGTTLGWSKSKRDGEKECNITAPATEAAALWDGWGTALKPAYEPVIVAMKPIDGTFVNNALEHGVAGLWIDGARVGTESTLRNSNSGTNGDGWGMGKKNHRNGSPQGRWPANLIHDGSDEVLAEFPETGGAGNKIGSPKKAGSFFGKKQIQVNTKYDMGGSAARFFYCAKASRAERNEGLEEMKDKLGGLLEGGNDKRNGKDKPQLKPIKNNHPTVKPLALIEYLCKLTKTPTGGVVLDLFMGSGTTGVACVQTGRNFIGIEIDKDYFAIAEKRITEAQLQTRMEI